MSWLRLLVHLSALGLLAVGPVATGISGRAEASVVIDISQVGSDVVAEGNGTIDLTGLTKFGFSSAGGVLWPAIGAALVGGGAIADAYVGLSGPSSFGTGPSEGPDSRSGDLFGIWRVALETGAAPVLFVPTGYVSGPLSGSMVYDGQTISSLGLTPGTYVYTWGPPADDDSLTVKIGTIPEPSTWAMMLLGFVGLGFAGYRRARAAPAQL